MSDYRYGVGRGPSGPPMFGGRGSFRGGHGGGGGPGRGSYYGPPAGDNRPPPMAQFPPRGPAMGAFPPHVQARPAGMTGVPPVAMHGGGFPPRGVGQPVMAMLPQSMAIARPMAQPAPLPAGWSEHYTPQGVRYFYNTNTGVSTYDLPIAMVTSAAEPTAQNGASAAASTTPAVAVTWIEYKDDATGQKYYYNTITKGTTWDQPEEFRMQQARMEVEKMKSSTEATGVVVAEEQRRKDQKKKLVDEEAAKTFEAMSKDDRVTAFKTFLEEKQVSSQFKWQEAQRFITKEGLDKDPRWKFALATVGEKKQAFSEYCTQAEKKQNIERRRQAKRIREEFLELLTNIEDKVVRSRFNWEDLNEGTEFYGLRKDPRWLAIEETKDKKDLFEGFLQDALRRKTQIAAKQAEQFKEKFLAKLREKTQDPADRALFAGKRRLDSALKKKVWQYFDEIDGVADVRDAIPKHDVYDWTEQFLDVLKAEESEFWKAERERKKQLEEVFTTKLHELVDAWLESEKLTMNSSWKEDGDAVSKECLSDGNNAASTTLSERRRRRVFEKKIKQVRERVQPAVATVQQFVEKTVFSMSPASTYEEFCAALQQGIAAQLEASKPEEGEEEETPTTSEANPQAPVASPTADFRTELERAVQESSDSVAAVFPLIVKHVFQLLQFQCQRAKTSTATREPSRSPSPSSRKRRRSSVDSTRRSQSPSLHRSRSRSRSNSRSSRRRRRSRSQSRDPRAALAATSYGNLPLAAKRFQFDAPSAVTVHGPPPPVVDEAAKAEEIIRQARLKMQAKQEAKQRGGPAAVDSEPEEGEEVEDGECEE